MQLSYLLLFSLVGLASANTLPNSDSTQAVGCGYQMKASYDDLPASASNPFPPYLGLKYNNVVLLTVGEPLIGIKPASSPNVVGFGSTSSVTTTGGGTGYRTFSPRRIAYACAVGAVETVVGVPISCTLAFLGYKGDRLKKRQVVNYQVAIGEVNKTMSVANLNGFVEMDTLRFEIVTPMQSAVAPRFDDFSYFLECS